MARSDTLRSEITRLETAEAGLRHDLARHQDQDKKLVAAEKKIGEMTARLAANSKAQTDRRCSLTTAERSERDPQDPVEFDVLAQVLAATSTPPRVLVLIACQTLTGADLLLPAVPVVIAMADTIDDTAAIVFARRFYAAIASARPVGFALAQARAAMQITTSDDADLPQVAVRDDVDADELVLVDPPGAAPAPEPALVLLPEHGLSPLAVAILRHVQALEADDFFPGVLTADAVAAAVDSTPRTVKIELKRLLEDCYLTAADQAEDLAGGFDLDTSRLTTRGAVLAR